MMGFQRYRNDATTLIQLQCCSTRGASSPLESDFVSRAVIHYLGILEFLSLGND